MTDEGGIIEVSTKSKLDYKIIVMFYIDRIGKAAVAPLSINKDANDTFRNSIKVLDSLLTPYRDKDYQAQKDKIAAESESKNIVTIEQWFSFFGLLVNQIKKAGLMPPTDVILDDDSGIIADEE